ncbi:hypothetical protein [Mangrovibrevibacter kandeliae]|uniref:hypothetical protein n=1 Tax=Mangrovibrevibacter kandeliae TaxID=2968473 RepID=UPI002117EC13|nr:hypothetical protein [Aurantimonas sp. CSK15Z-1]MCQ8781729.1 hypothetical protein [Aurantimonas sp. CSK15Z-1]
MRSAAVLVVALVLLSGCGAAVRGGLLASQGALSIEPSIRPDADYDVAMLNIFDIGFDASKPEDRRPVMLEKAHERCQQPRLVAEREVPNGTTPIGRRRVTYIASFKCG